MSRLRLPNCPRKPIATRSCDWCNTPFEVTDRRATAKRFCSRYCKNQLWKAYRTLGVKEALARSLPVDQLRELTAKGASIIDRAK
jgi:hypothetical protein